MEQNNGRPAAQWLDTATKAIRFGPDRRAVRAELEAHLEDKALDFQRIFPDLTREEAQERAAAEMGDPEEVGRELAKIHKPWLGWLWRASQFALGAAVALLVLLLADPASYTLRPGEQGIVSSAEWLAEHQADSFERQPISGWEEQQVGQYNIQVKEARLWRIPGGPARAVYVLLEVRSPRPWAGLDPEVMEHMWAVDDLGNRIVSLKEADGQTAALEWARTARPGPFQEAFSILVPLPDPQAERITLRYDELGVQCSIPITWKETVG